MDFDRKIYFKKWRKDNTERIKQYRKDNIEQISEQRKQYYKANVERIKQKCKQYRKDNTKRIKEYDKQYRKDNTERIKEHKKQYRKDNVEWIKKYRKQYAKDNPEKINAKNRKRRALKNGASGYHTENDLQYIYEQQNGKCISCGKKILYNKMTVDHIEPLSKGGSDLPYNIQLLCGSCNSSKGNHHATDYREFEIDLLRNKSSIRMIFEEK